MNDGGPAQRRPFLFGLPVVATLVVVAAVAVMISLGVWQLDRAAGKEALLARFGQNVAAPSLLLTSGTDLDANLLRRVTVDCPQGSPARLAGAGRYGYRVIADCTAPALGRSIAVQLGTQPRPTDAPAWKGGMVRGYLAPAPDNRSLLRQLVDRAAVPPMIVADPPLAGLAANPAPSLADIPNNHRSYAVQWFAFAGIAVVIYLLAVKGRRRRA